jgi:hypothetical protein
MPDNLALLESTLGAAWDCSGPVQLTYNLGGTVIAHDATTPMQHLFACTIWCGTCDSGQLMSGGLRDSTRHGKVRPPSCSKVCISAGILGLVGTTMAALASAARIQMRYGCAC